LLTDANIARTANQRVDYNAQVVETHDVEAARVKGKLLTNANIARTADQHTTQSALTHATATATPDIDRTQHLDSNATGQDRQTAKLNAVMEQSQVNADAVKGLQLVQANQRRTASQHVTEEPHNGIDGKTGAQGEKGDAGVTTTITKVQTDTATQTQVAQNQTTLRHVQEEQTAQGEYVQHMNQTVSHTATLAASNSQRLNAVESHQKSLEQQQSNDREEYRAGIAGAVAISGLHYTETDNSVAIGAGDFKNEQGYALGYRHKFSDNVATTVAASETSNGDAMFSASAAIGW
ncbi:YadA C-terminal domain-containing protein, partial [Enterobacter sp. 186315]